jgi:nitroreductase
MDVLASIKQRRSIRAFTREVPEKKIIQECLEAAIWAPSATNQQPWEFIVLTGEPLAAVCGIIEEKFAECMQHQEAFGNPQELLKKRQQEIFAAMLDAADEAGIDANEIFEKSLRFFDAPVGVFFVTFKSNDNQYELSAAAALENFLLAAHACNLGTCWLTVTVICQEDIKKHLGLPDDRILLGGVALGYAAEDHPLNRFPRTRSPVAAVTAWHGF